jgi:putative hydrolase of the HAD superfamily
MALHLPPAILFDMDDTILAYDAGADDVWRRVCAAGEGRGCGCRAGELFAAICAVRDWYWADAERHRRGRLDLQGARREIVRAAFERLSLVPGELADELADSYSTQREEAVRPFPGACETLAALRRTGIGMALITNGHPSLQRRKIDAFGLEPYFDCILIEGEFGCGKPDERVYHHALACLGIEPRQAWMVGDNLEWEVAVPQRLGLYAVWVDAYRKGLPPGTPIRPDRTIHSLTELLPG